MNKYIYKVKFVFKFLYTTEQRVMHKDELIFGKQQSFNNRKNSLQTNNLKSMNASCLFSQKFHFLTSDC